MQRLLLKPFSHSSKQVEIHKPPLSFPSKSKTQTPPSFLKVVSQRVVPDKKDYIFLHRNDGEEVYELTSHQKSEGEQNHVSQHAIPEVSGNPCSSQVENELRWQFFSRVYGILAAQISFCAAVSTVIVLCPPVKEFLISWIHSATALSVALLPFICFSEVTVIFAQANYISMINAVTWPLAVYRKQHPVNMILLGLVTACTSIDIALCCAAMKVKIVLQALLLTVAGVSSLTGYTFWASKKGSSFNYLGPFLSSSLAILLVTGILQLFFPLVSKANALYAGVVAMVFSGYLVYDTDSMIKHHKYDEYVVASVNIFLDMVILFISNLDLLQHCSDLFT